MDAAWLDAVVLLTTGAGTCAGAVIEPAGTVLTAYHCVATGVRTRVETRGGAVAWGRMVAADPAHDLALVRVSFGAAPAPLTLADTEPPPGAELWAIGHPYATAATGALSGTLRWSVTRGVVSAVGDTFVQTDAALNPGNSGGPLLDASGRLVAVVSRKLAADNLSFGTRVGVVREFLEGRPRPALLGGTYGVGLALTPTRAQGYALAGELGVVVRERVWVRAQVGGVLADTSAPLLRGGLGLRQRVGTGPMSTTVDLGAGLSAETPLEPEVLGRVSAVGVGLGAVWAPVSGAWGLEASVSLPWHGAW